MIRARGTCTDCGGPTSRQNAKCWPCRWPRDTAARFWALVDRADPDACWEWRGLRAKGYGQYRGHILAHRRSYELTVGPIPTGLELDHLCSNPGCVNPAHLEPVTHEENSRRAWVRGECKRPTHCQRGLHVLEPGRGRCLPCNRLRHREYMRTYRRAVA